MLAGAGPPPPARRARRGRWPPAGRGRRGSERRARGTRDVRAHVRGRHDLRRGGGRRRQRGDSR
ncbi:MAG: hypothetical protein BRD44_06715 [Bacteroidetes bacterium QS_7_67_15]|nr:MAG: hypothetical protein BRD44_06715 [Bacteroidetes bacterium QS_7_67_15]